MKQVLLIATLALITLSANAQSLNSKDNAAIDAKVDQFLKLMEKKDYTKVLDFMYPPIFEHTSKKDI